MKFFLNKTFCGHLFLALGILLGACSSRTVAPLTAPSARLFPDGIYKHWVSLKIHRPRKDEEHSFLGVVELRPEQNKVVGLSPFGSTLFRLTDNLKEPAPAQVDIYIEAMKPFEARLRQMYTLLKQVLALPRSAPLGPSLPLPAAARAHLTSMQVLKLNEYQLPQEIETQVDGEKIHIHIDTYTPDSIPKSFAIHHPTFDVQVKVSTFELAPAKASHE